MYVLMRFSAVSISLASLIGAGVWLDNQITIDQLALFAAFQYASLLGIILAIAQLWPRFSNPLLRVLLIVGSFIAWRIAYFPIMVFAGWFATLGEWLTLTFSSPWSFIYPTFLVVMALFHWGIIKLSSLIIHSKRRAILLVTLMPACLIAVFVSFTAQTDYTLLPDYHIAISQTIPVPKTPLQNPYFTALSTEPDYNIAERVLVFASGAMYSMIPTTPWSRTVKQVLAQAFYDTPKASSATRIKEHYIAFRNAQHQLH